MKNCVECGARLRGRSDKKFCNINCRNAHHNGRAKPQSPVVRKINRNLNVNRKILLELSKQYGKEIPSRSLVAMGFNFELFTSILRNSEGEDVLCLYDLRYRIDDWGTLHLLSFPEITSKAG